ncbi:ethanolamine ammonia-lyase [Allomyces macrogynus ATCC 38327]|uniref:Ethanolamine ammonia-lyase n=1 Tax=Allomyces macrogynus (strain ATCC 38327) TaxID=578462 RepID=A0A0L0SU69_ALLM3|nr:ethanolamine ammonia-lyase [Allomyces macrogynus ATCC 38327]|eukprot:KNE66001.1 ethanolamine ammonia-lyase [Allomyces macrogynus ATCC 38327]
MSRRSRTLSQQPTSTYKMATAIGPARQSVADAFQPTTGTDPPNPVRFELDEAPTDLRRLFGLANEFKEGDDVLGIASHSPAERDAARLQLSLLRVGGIRPARFSDDRELSDYVEEFGLDLQVAARIAGWTLGELREFLVNASEGAIRTVLPGLRSEVIAGVVKLMSNDNLICLRMRRRHLWHDLPNVATLEAVLLDMIQTFQLGDKTKHCVLAHLDEQMAVHAGRHRDDAARRSRSPGPVSSSSSPSPPPAPVTTERSASSAAQSAAQLIESTPGNGLIGVAFQSIGGTSAVNRVFGISVASLRAAAASVPALNFETGQGSAVTNGASDGIDMVKCEARAHSLARALRKLHGLTFDLDICATCHMGITLDDIEFIEETVLAAGPGLLHGPCGSARRFTGTHEMRDFVVHDRGFMNHDGSMTARTGTRLPSAPRTCTARGTRARSPSLSPKERAILVKLQHRGLDLGYGHDGAFPAPAARGPPV